MSAVRAASTMSERRVLDAETVASTPHSSVKSHILSASLTRATTRGTAQERLASSDMTRLSSSCPVTATSSGRCDPNSDPSSESRGRCRRLAQIALFRCGPPSTLGCW